MEKILDLTKQNNGISYKIHNFPDGQQSITLSDVASPGLSFIKTTKVTIKSRLNSFKDLELIICATQALRELKIKDISLYVPYFLGARSDRKFEVGGINYIKNVISPIINLMNFNEVFVMDPHSDVLEACINNFTKYDSRSLVGFAFNDTLKKSIQGTLKTGTQTGGYDFDNVLLVAPDAGSLKRVYNISNIFGYTNHVICGTKNRNPITGKILSVGCDLSPNDANKDMFLIDDIGDGFGTFIELAKSISEIRKLSSSVKPENYGKLYLIVTHSIQENGIKKALEVFDGIWTTNSVNNWNNIDRLKVLNVF